MSIRMGSSVGRRDQLLQQVESFFREHLQRTRGASRHTVFSYRDSLQLFFCYLADANGRDVSKLRLDDITESKFSRSLTTWNPVVATAWLPGIAGSPQSGASADT